jgi:hypothetical protein
MSCLTVGRIAASNAGAERHMRIGRGDQTYGGIEPFEATSDDVDDSSVPEGTRRGASEFELSLGVRAEHDLSPLNGRPERPFGGVFW